MFVCLFLIIVPALLLYYCREYQYWRKKNVPFLRPQFPFGNFGNPFTDVEGFGMKMSKIYKEIKQNGCKHGGVYYFNAPIYVVVEPDYIKKILTTDFQYFHDGGQYHNEKDDPLSVHLNAMSGEKWKMSRNTFSPIFSLNRLKLIFQNLVSHEYILLGPIETEYKKREPLHVENFVKSTWMELIGICVFGGDADRLMQNGSVIKEYITSLNATRLYDFKKSFSRYFPNLANMFHVTFTPKKFSKYFIETITKLLTQKNDSKSQDYMQMFVDLKNHKNVAIQDIILQCFTFLASEGIDGVPNTLSLALYEVAKHQTIQTKLRQEFQNVLTENQGEISYDGIQKMTYLRKVIDESLRKYPGRTVLRRKCVQDYTLKDEDVILKKGTSVAVSIYGIHHDEEYYPEPEKFDPERFNQVPNTNTYMPFGKGPRNCFGMRLALMAMKFYLVSLLLNYRFTLNDKTKDPLLLRSFSSNLEADGGIWLNIEKV